MTLYLAHGGHECTAHERADGSWGVRFKRGVPKNCGLAFAIGDWVQLFNRKGEVVRSLRVHAYKGRIVYGGFTRSGIIFTE